MMRESRMPNALAHLLLVVVTTCQPRVMAEQTNRVDLLSFAQGAIPVGIDGAAAELGVGMNEALQAIDGDRRGFALTPKPGGAEAAIVLLYELPSMTIFEQFAVPDVLETPSPSQTFVRSVTIAGAESSRDGPFADLAEVVLETHQQAGETTVFRAAAAKPVRWLRVTFRGGIKVEREKTFFQFSEIMGYGTQTLVPLSQAFSGKWKGRGVKLELQQDGVRVGGCYDGEGDLEGTVSGNLLRATGKARKSGVPSTFVLSVRGNDQIIGVRSTNGAPFRLYHGDPAPALNTECSQQRVAALGCGAVIHGIHFDFDSATIRPESEAHLTALRDGLQSSTTAAVVVVGHTSSEGTEAYNDGLSQRRAAAVAAAMVARGIEAGRISAQGQGEKQPLADNASETGRSLNRRVEIVCR